MQLEKGMRIECVIQGDYISDALVQEEDGSLFICQDHKDGNPCNNKLGYKYSWEIGDGSDYCLNDEEVSDIEIIDEVEKDEEIDDSDHSNHGLKEGLSISCTINNCKVRNAAIQKENKLLYICQNVIAGSVCNNRFGFDYSWCIESGSDKDLMENNVKNVKILGEFNPNFVILG